MKKNALKLFQNKTIFITGGTGSFGSFFVREILAYKPKLIIIFSRDEDKQHTLQYDLSDHKKDLRFVVGDVRDKESLRKATKDEIDILIHAAAMKQIPSTEYNVIEAVKTNILGAQNVVDICLENGIPKALSISTDKAVEPINVMGMTKALQERIFTLANKYKGKAKTRFASVRYGNVVASRGSVIPLFKKQIEAGGPVTLTDQGMTRFILTLREATGLVFNALENIVGGEIFVPKIKSIRVIDLAQVMVEELKPKDGRIVEIGIRPGEKIHETLISLIESARAIEKRDYFIVLPQIELDKIGFTYKMPSYKDRQMFSYSSENGPFFTKHQIRGLLRSEGVI